MFQPEKRFTAEEALDHPWITHSFNNNFRTHSNLIANVRRGFSSLPSFRSTSDNLSEWNKLENNNENEKIHEEESKLKDKPKRKSLLGKHLKIGL